MSWSRIIVGKTADCADAGIQTIRYGDNHDQRHRIGKKIKKAQFKIGKLVRSSTTAQVIWAAVLAS